MAAEVRADEILTRRQAVGVWFSRGSPRVLAALFVSSVVGRVLVARWTWLDLLVLAAVALATAPVEWLLHGRVLHADIEAWTSRRLGTGRRHAEHHRNPADLDYALLRAHDAAALAGVLMIAVGGLSVGVGRIGGWGAACALTAMCGAVAAVLRYEWTHLLVHTRAPLRSRRLQRLASAHRLHHYRNEQYWLGVTSHLGDRVFGTLPADRSAVPLSETVRTLD